MKAGDTFPQTKGEREGEGLPDWDLSFDEARKLARQPSYPFTPSNLWQTGVSVHDGQAGGVDIQTTLGAAVKSYLDTGADGESPTIIANVPVQLHGWCKPLTVLEGGSDELEELAEMLPSQLR